MVHTLPQPFLTPSPPHLLIPSPPHLLIPSPPHLPQLLEVYKNLQHEHDALKTFSEENEKKCQQKMSEMREVQALDHQAKAHMEEAFRLTLEEKDEKINVMQMQVGGAEGGASAWRVGKAGLSSKPEVVHCLGF